MDVPRSLAGRRLLAKAQAQELLPRLERIETAVSLIRDKDEVRRAMKASRKMIYELVRLLP